MKFADARSALPMATYDRDLGALHGTCPRCDGRLDVGGDPGEARFACWGEGCDEDTILAALAPTTVPGNVVNGAEFILDAPSHVPAVWGRGTEVLWAEGESLLLTGPPGVGKSTIGQQVIRARLGLATDVLGYPVADDGRRVLLLALDRPPQIARSLRRMFTEADHHVLSARLTVVKGLPFDIVKHPGKLAELVREHDAGTLVIDSLKDAALELSRDEVGGAITRAIRGVLDTGCQVLAIHHHRKGNADNKKPNKLSDVYGSTWLTAGAGSVVTVWGDPGDVLVELLHLKQPADEIGPLELEHDHRAGQSTVRESPTVWSVLHQAITHGITAPDLARAIHGTKASRARIEKVRRDLERYVEEGHARRTPDVEGTVYHPISANGAVCPRVPPRVGDTDPARDYTEPAQTATRDHTDDGEGTRPLKEVAARAPSDATPAEAAA